MTNKFKNTYINTSHLSIDEMNNVITKYCKASGLPLERGLGSVSGYSPVHFNYVTTVRVATINDDPLDCISVTDSPKFLGVDVSDLTEITEADLDNHLASLDKEEKKGKVFFPNTIPTYSPKDLNGLSGKIVVTEDDNKEIVIFHSDDGHKYVLSVC